MQVQLSKPIFYLLVASGLLLGQFYAVTMIVDPDVGQILYKAKPFVEEGILSFHGNRSSGMGSIPGALTTLLAGLPMLVINDIQAPLLLIQVFHLLALFMVLDVVRRKIGPGALPWVLLLFWLNPWRVSEIFLWNPTYLIFTAALHLWSASKMEESKSFLYSFLHVLAIALSMQLHNSYIILIFISLILFYRKVIKVSWSGVAVCIALAVGSLIPFFIELVDNPDLLVGNKDPDAFLFRGLLYIFPTVKGLMYWARFNSGFFPKDVFKGVDLAMWMGENGLSSSLNTFWDIFKHLVAVGTALFVIKWNYEFFRPRVEKLKFWKRFELEGLSIEYSIAAFIALIVVGMMSPIDFNYWHLILLFPASQLPLFLKFNKPLEWKYPAQKIYWALVAYCILANLLMAAGSRKHSVTQLFALL